MKKNPPIRAWQVVVLLLLVLALILSRVFASTADNSQLFQEANVAYQSEDYAAAIALYRDLLTRGQSANLHYNLGNAYYQQGDYGSAILQYEKALLLSPGNPDIQANLKLARRAADVPPPQRTLIEQFAGHAHVNTWTWLAVLSFWAGCFLFVLPRYYRWNIPLRRTILLVCFLGFVSGVTGMAGYHTLAKEGVVLAANAPLKVAPTSTSPERTTLQAGSLATIQQQHGAYYLVQTTGNQSGWISSDQFQPIRE